MACARFPLQVLQRLGSFLNCLSWKKSCSPAVKTKSAPQSTHFRTLSWNSIERLASAHDPPAPHAPEPRAQPLVRPSAGHAFPAAHNKTSRVLVLRELPLNFLAGCPPAGRASGLCLILLLASFLAAALARQRLFHALLL